MSTVPPPTTPDASPGPVTPGLATARAAGPAPGRWRLDPGHAEVTFVGRHFLLTRVRGRFSDIDGLIEVADDPLASTVDVTIAMASVTSGSEDRDAHLRSDELFDVERYPEATYHGRLVTWDGRQGRVVGDLRLKDVARPVELALEFLGQVDDPWGNTRAVFSARGQIRRGDWGVGWNMRLDSGGLMVSKEIDLEIDVEAILER